MSKVPFEELETRGVTSKTTLSSCEEDIPNDSIDQDILNVEVIMFLVGQLQI